MKKVICSVLVVAILLTGLVLSCAQAPTSAPAPSVAPAPAPSPASAPASKPASTPASTPAPAPAPAKPAQAKTLKAVSFLASFETANKPFFEWIDNVNKAQKDTIRHLGGPEVMPSQELLTAVSKGVIDIALVSAGVSFALVPESMALQLSQQTVEEEKKTGFRDLLNQQFTKKANSIYLGDFSQRTPRMVVITKFKAAKPEDLKGKKMRSTSTYEPFLKALGTATINIGQADLYSALQQGVVDGTIQPIGAIDGSSLTEVSRYLIDHPFYGGGSQLVVINQESWKALPDSIQKSLTSTIADMEIKSVKFWADQEVSDRKVLQSKKMEFLKFSEADAKRYVDMAYTSLWARLAQTAPDTTAQLKKLSGQ